MPPSLRPERSGSVLQPAQRTQGVHRGAVRVGLAERVVEDLERQRPVVAGGKHVGDEGGQVEGALAGEQPVVTAPREHVHVQRGRVGQLEEEDLVGRDVLDRAGIVSAGQHVEAVEAHPDVRVVGKRCDAPRPAVVVDEPAPGQRLERHLDVVSRGEVAESAQLIGRHLVGVDGRRGHVAADEDGADAEALRGDEGGACAAQVVGEGVLVDALDIAQRLIEVQRKAEPAAQRTDLFRAVVVGDQVRFEQLDTVETRRRAGVQLLGERTAQRDRCDGRLHRLTSSCD